MNDPHLASQALRPFIRAALAEDIGSGDASTLAIVDERQTARALLATRQDCRIAGLAIAELVFHELDPAVMFQPLCRDGDSVSAGTAVARIQGPARAILTGERTALNLLQRLSGIATLTARFVTTLNDSRIAILDTRKTTPNMRALEKYAVRCGGGENHRFGLFDRIMLKDNHLALAACTGEGSIARAVSQCRARYPDLQVEVEADRLEQVKAALVAGADWILLDNMGRAMIDEAVVLRDRICRATRLEASGGISLETIARLRGSGIDAISIGALTHSVAATDIGLDFDDGAPSQYPDGL